MRDDAGNAESSKDAFVQLVKANAKDSKREGREEIENLQECMHVVFVHISLKAYCRI